MIAAILAVILHREGTGTLWGCCEKIQTALGSCKFHWEKSKGV